MLREESMAYPNASGPARPLDTKVDVSRRGPIAALNELVRSHFGFLCHNC